LAGLITFDTILTDNEEMRRSIEKAKMLSTLPNATLICGETGTGKELFAQAMINYSGVPKRNVVIQNCAAVPENLMESILFGTVRGAYTGAENKKGLFEVADGGIIFLDELNSMPFHVQAKLLRVLQDGSFKPLGINEDKKVSTKVIAAMNIDLEKAIQRKILRKDLFYRFSGGLITLLPLRERREDIIMYTNYYINYFSDIYDKKVGKFSKDLEEKFYRYNWEGNVRELMNTVEFMVTTARNGEDLTENLIPAYLRGRLDNVFSISDENDIFPISNIISEHKCKQSKDTHIPYHNIMDTVEKELILKAMEVAEGNKSKASEILGLPRQTFRYRLQKLGLEELSD
jgi:arginine utilization regulatory protein